MKGRYRARQFKAFDLQIPRSNLPPCSRKEKLCVDLKVGNIGGAVALLCLSED